MDCGCGMTLCEALALGYVAGALLAGALLLTSGEPRAPWRVRAAYALLAALSWPLLLVAYVCEAAALPRRPAAPGEGFDADFLPVNRGEDRMEERTHEEGS